MKIELEVEDISTFADGLNNSIIAYGEIVSTIFLGCEVPARLQGLKNISDERLQQRLESLKQVYKQVLEIEREEKEKN